MKYPLKEMVAVQMFWTFYQCCRLRWYRL